MANEMDLQALGMSVELSVEVKKQIESAVSPSVISQALAEKPEIAALDEDSTTADIVAALQA